MQTKVEIGFTRTMPNGYTVRLEKSVAYSGAAWKVTPPSKPDEWYGLYVSDSPTLEYAEWLATDVERCLLQKKTTTCDCRECTSIKNTTPRT